MSQIELELGNITAALATIAQAVQYADRVGDGFVQSIVRTTHAVTLQMMGRATESRILFAQAEKLQAVRLPKYPLLPSLQGFRYCELLLADGERMAWAVTLGLMKTANDADSFGEVADRANWMLERHVSGDFGLVSLALSHLILARTYLQRRVVRDGPDWHAEIHDLSDAFGVHLAAAVSGLRAVNTMDYLPLGLLTLAWVRFLEGDIPACKSALAEAREIAERGPMPLHLADIELTTARLFKDRQAVAEARRLIFKHGYHRRDGELQDAEEASRTWP